MRRWICQENINGTDYSFEIPNEYFRAMLVSPVKSTGRAFLFFETDACCSYHKNDDATIAFEIAKKLFKLIAFT